MMMMMRRSVTSSTSAAFATRLFSSKKSKTQQLLEKEAIVPSIAPVEDDGEGAGESLADKDIVKMVSDGTLKHQSLETFTGDLKRAVKLRRRYLTESEGSPQLKDLPWANDLDYAGVHGTCCENTVGYIPLPVGIAGPIQMNGAPLYLPMATTEGCLVASTHRGCKAINESGGATAFVTADGMTRGPVVKMPSVADAVKLKAWLEFQENVFQVASAFNSTSRFARLSALKVVLAGHYVFIRFKSTTGDAMGMNMISKGVEKALAFISEHFPHMDILSVSGNFCTDKKSTALNWIDGRGKSVVAEAVITKEVVAKTLKTSVDALVEVNMAKNMLGSAMAGALGGFNAHASNIVTSVFLATGQDPAQNVESSSCIDIFEKTANGDLRVSVSMPSIEVGTIGGGTGLPAQASCLELMGVQGTSDEIPGANARQLAKGVATAVLAGELSLMSALAAGHLVRAHMIHNRGGSHTTEKTKPEPVLVDGTLYGHD